MLALRCEHPRGGLTHCTCCVDMNLVNPHVSEELLDVTRGVCSGRVRAPGGSRHRAGTACRDVQPSQEEQMCPEDIKIRVR